MKSKLLIVCALVFWTARLQAAIFMKIEGVEGESTAKGHEREIEIVSYSMGMVNTPVVGGGGASAGKVQFQDFHFTKRTDKSSPVMMLQCASGTHVREAIITLMKTSGDVSIEYMKVTLTDVLISSFSSAGSSGPDYPMEEIAMSFGKIKIEYFPQRADGTTEPPVVFTWDLATGTAN